MRLPGERDTKRRDKEIRVACYMANASIPWIKKVWENEMIKEETALKSEAEKYLRRVRMTAIKMPQDGVERNTVNKNSGRG